LNQLREYMDKNVLAPERSFVCKSVEACKRSAEARDPHCRFFEGQLSHVGTHYDLTQDGRPLRILVVPMDTGHGPPRVTLEDRRRQVDTAKSQDGRNHHMWGTVLVLRLAVGREPGRDPEGEMLRVDVGNWTDVVHLVDCYAMANVRLCSATAATGRESRGTRTMSWNCLRHLEATAKILQPSLCIIQGAGVKTDIDTAPASIFGRRERITDNLEWVHLDGRQVLLASFWHPSRTWFWPEAPYLRDVVVPTIRAARKELGLRVTHVH
jgi:hypothetical protein